MKISNKFSHYETKQLIEESKLETKQIFTEIIQGPRPLIDKAEEDFEECVEEMRKELREKSKTRKHLPLQKLNQKQ